MRIFDGKLHETLSLPVECRCPRKNTSFALCTSARPACIIEVESEIFSLLEDDTLKYDIQTKLYRMAIRLEVLVGICILIAVAAATLGLLADIHIPTILSSPESLQAYLTTAMTIIIGVEFVKMIFSYTIDTVIEVMLLAVARQMVVTHTSPTENLITIISVTLLFAVRKFLFVPKLDHVKPDTDSSLLPRFPRRKNDRHEPAAPSQSNPSAAQDSAVTERKEDDTSHAAP